MEKGENRVTTNPNVYLVQKFSVRSHNEYFNDFLWMLAPRSQLRSRYPRSGIGTLWREKRSGEGRGRIEGRSREEQTAAEGKSSVSPFLRNYNRATYRGTAPSVSTVSISLPLSSASTLVPRSRALLSLYRTLISFYGNCVYGTTRELQVFVIPWNCQALVASFKGSLQIVSLFDKIPNRSLFSSVSPLKLINSSEYIAI